MPNNPYITEDTTVHDWLFTPDCPICGVKYCDHFRQSSNPEHTPPPVKYTHVHITHHETTYHYPREDVTWVRHTYFLQDYRVGTDSAMEWLLGEGADA